MKQKRRLEEVFEVVTSREFMGWSLSGRHSGRFGELFRQISELEAEARTRSASSAASGSSLPAFDHPDSSSSSSEDFSPSGFYRAWEAFGTVLTDLDFGDDYDAGGTCWFSF